MPKVTKLVWGLDDDPVAVLNRLPLKPSAYALEPLSERTIRDFIHGITNRAVGARAGLVVLRGDMYLLAAARRVSSPRLFEYRTIKAWAYESLTQVINPDIWDYWADPNRGL